ncbi:MAG: YciI family protein [Chloroflexia bacterium]
MANYVLLFHGGRAPQTDAERDAILAKWGQWYGRLGAAVVDDGNPFTSSATVAADGTVADGPSSDLTGYAIISAGDLNAAAGMTKGCPILADGGSIEVHEIHNAM